MHQRTARNVLWSLLLCSLAIAAWPESSGAKKKARRRILYVTNAAGFKHDVLPFSQGVLQRLGEQSGAFESIATFDCSLINADYLKNFGGLVFYTMGELPLSEEQKQFFLDFIKSGKGLIGIHSATDTF